MFSVWFVSDSHHATEVTCTKEQRLLVLATTAGLPLPHTCGGHGRCGTCRILIEEGADHLTPSGVVESRRLEAMGASPDERLGCQAWARGPLTCRIPCIRNTS